MRLTYADNTRYGWTYAHWRDLVIYRMYKEGGLTLQCCGSFYGLTKQRAEQIVKGVEQHIARGVVVAVADVRPDTN
jgi:hypothetical protein